MIDVLDLCDEVPAQMRLRPYQVECIDAVREGWKEVTRQIVVMAGGCGKTVILSKIAQEEVAAGGRVLIIAHTDELLEQAIDKIYRSTGIVADKEKAEDSASPYSSVVVASVQTLSRDSRLLGFSDNHFTLVVVDECFPCTTLVDGRYISSYKAGDFVQSFNHDTGVSEMRRILRVYKKPVRSLLTIRFSDGRKIRCTPDHPFFSASRGIYVPAIKLTCEDMVVSTTHEQTSEDATARCLCRVRHHVHDLLQGAEPVSKERGSSLLPAILHKGILRSGECEITGGNKSEIRVGKDDCEKPNETCAREGEGEDVFTRHGVEAESSGRERNWSDASPAANGVGSRVGNGNCGSNQNEERDGISNVLQDRRGEHPPKNRRGGRWIQPLLAVSSATRHKESRFTYLVRVDNIEVHEQGGRDGYTEMCPDGFVYNIEVEGNNNYFAEGILVHNCHRSLSRSYLKVIYYFHYGQHSLADDFEPPEIGVPYQHKARILGVTATASRGDKKDLGELFQKVAFEYGLLEAVRDGYLVRPIVKNIPLKIDMRGVRISRSSNGSDFDLAEVTARIAPIIREVAKQIAIHAPQLKTVVFTPSVETARMLSEALAQEGMNSWFVSGACRDRDDKIERFRSAGPGTVLANALLVVEGFDVPDITGVCVLRPTKIWGFFVQACVRGTRTLAGLIDNLETREERIAAIAASEKPNFTILDFLWLTDRIDLVQPVDLVASKPEIRKAMLASGATDLVASEASAERDLLKSLEAAAKKHARKQARTIDPIAWSVSLGDAALAGYEPETRWDSEPPTQGQKDFLSKQGIDPTNIRYKGLASKIINRLVGRLKMHLATPRQLSLMHQLGLDEQTCATLTAKEATVIIDRTLQSKRAN